MNALCSLCPVGIVLQALFPDTDERIIMERLRACLAEQENGSLKEIMIEQGLNCAFGERRKI